MDLTCSADICSGGGNMHDMTSTALMFGSSSASPVKLGSLLLFLLGFQDQTSAVITNVSVIQSWRWFFHLSPFESVFLAVLIAQIGLLSLLGILPINITEFWEGMASGRRKKRRANVAQPSVPPHVALATKEIGSKLLLLYKKLDQNQCGFRALCELQSKVTCGEYDKRRLPQATQLVLTTFPSLAEQPSTVAASDNEEKTDGSGVVDINVAIQPYAEAIKIGSQAANLDPVHYDNVTAHKGTKEYENACHRKYPDCPATSDELMEYIERINVLEY